MTNFPGYCENNRAFLLSEEDSEMENLIIFKIERIDIPENDEEKSGLQSRHLRTPLKMYIPDETTRWTPIYGRGVMLSETFRARKQVTGGRCER